MVVNYFIIGLLIATIAGFLFYVAFGKIAGIDINQILSFAKQKQNLVRYYSCSLALCAKGCGSYEVNNICLERDLATKDCITRCKSYCERPPVSWGTYNDSWKNPGAVCGKNYNMSVQLEEEVAIGGQICKENYWWNFGGWTGGCRVWSTDITETIRYLNKTEGFPLPDPKFINSGMWLIGRMWVSEPGTLVWPVIPFPVNIKGEGNILLNSEDVTERFGCSGVSKDSGYDQCLFRQNLNIWTSFVSFIPSLGSFVGGDVFFNSSAPQPGNFKLKVINSDQVIRIGETATYNINLENHLGTESNFNFLISICSYNDGTENCKQENINCRYDRDLDLHCEDSFSKNDIKVSDEGSESLTLTLDPKMDGNYKFRITARPSAAYGSESVDATLKVTDFEVHLSPSEKNVKEGGEESFDVSITNHLDNDTTFTLDYSCIKVGGGTCTCRNLDPLTVIAGGRNFKPISCGLGSSVGSYKIRVFASDGVISKPSKEEVTLNIVKCFGDIKLEINPSTAKSNDKVNLKVSGLVDCAGVPVTLETDGVEFDHITIEEDPTGFTKDYTANTPGTYMITAKIDLLDDEYSNDSETDSASLTITAPSIDGKSCGVCGSYTKRCTFSFGSSCCYLGGMDILDYCQDCGDCIGEPLGGCKVLIGDCWDSLDPQKCEMYSSKKCADYSNVCGIYRSDSYSSGPSISCLSPDTTTHGGGNQNKYFTWRGSNLDSARNILVKDGKDGSDEFGTAKFTIDQCGSDNHCNGKDALSTFTGLNDAKCVTWNLGSEGIKNGCKLGSIDEPYFSWVYIQIANDGESRPVYGVKMIYKVLGHGVGKTHQSQIRFTLFLHNKDTGWSDGGTIYRNLGQRDNDEWLWFEDTLKPSGWSWDNIDAILIGYYGYYWIMTEMGTPRHDDNSWLDYVGLLTKDGSTPYCTEGNANDYYRIVNDNKKCYWNATCDISGGGWSGKSSLGLGPFIEANMCNCNSGDCGRGYCQNGNKCFYDVKCMNGGWQGQLVDCPPPKTCKSEGCS